MAIVVQVLMGTAAMMVPALTMMVVMEIMRTVVQMIMVATEIVTETVMMGMILWFIKVSLISFESLLFIFI